ncbi:hypothetical protein OG21DRAFT_114932 [Imleria badia]|nr:hypothetical protein OG21DRAFT_114932 [Imleria badia]
MSDFVGTSYLKSTICGIMNFADPALVERAYSSQDNVCHPTKLCDIYSFGGLMLHVLSGKKPYDGIPSPSIIIKVMKGERPEIPPHDKHITHWHKSLIRRSTSESALS